METAHLSNGQSRNNLTPLDASGKDQSGKDQSGEDQEIAEIAVSS
jgi:hypothetical protein